MSKVITIDFTGVEAGGNFARIPEGDYAFVVKKVDQKKGDKGPYLLFHLKATKGNPKGVGKTIGHICSLGKSSLWNLRNLMEAAGKQVPSKAIKIDTDKMVGWELAGTVVDDEYDGKMRSVAAGFFPISELAPETSSKKEETETTEGDETEGAAEVGSDEEVEELFE